MEISSFFTAIIIGAIIGIIGRLVVPGRQNISWWLTILIGIVAAIVGTVLAGVLGVDDTGGVDWIELVLQIGFAAAAIAVIAGATSRSRT